MQVLTSHIALSMSLQGAALQPHQVRSSQPVPATTNIVINHEELSLEPTY